ncbi:50S ribosomal protein L11 methyltransferase [Chrysiogenes arsenatis]|uniref:50S ribosomal protein L11 methyltransferase n=1 Tax=Chrysiogenes arsenatis TaxID=309797 RepID=UPI0006840E8C|nr:50S ribosomal protein L11 methyltransferase [Chrysiogenes arsenatis]
MTHQETALNLKYQPAPSIELKVSLPAAAIEEAEAWLTYFGAEGFVTKELEDEEGQERQTMKAYFPPDVYESNRVAVAQYLEEKTFTPFSATTVLPADWENCWKEFFSPLELRGGILINPAWIPITPEKAASYRAVIFIDPGMAFGTGQHPTTALCIEALGGLPVAGMSVLDIGTGSGILAICAQKLGAKPIVAIDNDSDCERVALKNMELNDVNPSDITVQTGTSDQMQGVFDIVLANITADVHLLLIDDYFRLGKKYLVLSGILCTREAEITTILRQKGLRNLQTVVDVAGQWCSIQGEF